MTTNVKEVSVDKLNKYLEFYDKKEQLIVLRRYIHRDIFTTHSSYHKVPQSINFRESYLVHRDDVHIHGNESEESLFDKLSTLQHNKLGSPNHNDKNHNKHISISFYEDDMESQSDAASSARDYSPPHSPVKIDKPEEKNPTMLKRILSHLRTDSEISSVTDLVSNDEPCEDKPLDTELETIDKNVSQTYKSNPDHDRGNSNTATIQLKDTVMPDLSWSRLTYKSKHKVSADNNDDFDFLKTENEQKSHSDPTNIGIEKYRSHKAALDTLIVKKKKPSSGILMQKTVNSESVESPEPLTSSNRKSISPDRFRHSISISPVATVDAGIPPKVPVHKKDSFKKRPSWSLGFIVSNSETQTPHQEPKTEKKPTYTRKCSYRRPKLSVAPLSEEPEQDELRELETKSITLSTDIVAEKRMFMLDGYKEESTKLHCLNPDSRVVSHSSARSQRKARPQSYIDFLDSENIWEGRAEAFAARIG